MRNFAELYDDIWKDHEFTNWSRFEHTLTLVPQISNEARIFDIAAGPGRFADFLLSRMPHVHKEQITCFEISPVAVKDLQQKGYQAQLFDIERMPIPKLADLIFFLETMEHVMEPGEVMKNLHQSLKPGGYLIISTPNYASWARRLKMFFGVIPEMYTSGNHHVSLFSVWFLKEQLQKHGFIIDEERNLFQMESMGRIWKKGIKPLFPHLQKRFLLPDYNYVPTGIFPNLTADLVLIRARRPYESPPTN